MSAATNTTPATDTIEITLWTTRPVQFKPQGKRESITRHAIMERLKGTLESFPAKEDAPGWAPTTFRGDCRSIANHEVSYGIGLDLDEEGTDLATDARSAADLAGFIYSTFNHSSEKQAGRAIVWTSRPVTAAEYDVCWAYLNRTYFPHAGQAAKDVARFWYEPSVRPESCFFELTGLPLDVDAVLAESSAPEAKAPAEKPKAKAEARVITKYGGAAMSNAVRDAAEVYRLAAVDVIAAAWPPEGPEHSGSRNHARMSLLGALGREGYDKEKALGFLEAVHEKRGITTDYESVVKATFKRLENDEKTSGWPTLRAQLSPPEAADEAEQLIKKAKGEELRACFPNALGAKDNAGIPSEDEPFLSEELDFTVDDPPPEWSVGRVFETESVNILGGLPGALKTWTAYSMCVAVSEGLPWLGAYPTKQGNALVLDFESGKRPGKRRLKQLGGKQGIYFAHHPGKLDDVETWKKIKREIERRRISFVVIDCLRAASSGDENDSTFAGALRAAGELCEPLGVTFVFLHHLTKDGLSLRGSGDIEGAADCVYLFSKATGDKDTGFRSVMKIAKRNGGEEEERIPLVIKLGDVLRLDTLAAEERQADPRVEKEVLAYLMAHTEPHRLRSVSARNLAEAIHKSKSKVENALECLRTRLGDDGVALVDRWNAGNRGTGANWQYFIVSKPGPGLAGIKRLQAGYTNGGVE